MTGGYETANATTLVARDDEHQSNGRGLVLPSKQARIPLQRDNSNALEAPTLRMRNPFLAPRSPNAQILRASGKKPRARDAEWDASTDPTLRYPHHLREDRSSPPRSRRRFPLSPPSTSS